MLVGVRSSFLGDENVAVMMMVTPPFEYTKVC